MKVTTEATELAIDGERVDRVRAAVHRPSDPRGAAFLLTHGAGGDLDGAPLIALADAIAAAGHLVVRANLPYREAGQARPPRADRSVPGFRAIARSARSEFGPRRPWIVGGKSYGGRVASMAVADGLEVRGLVFYGYPLHPPGQPGKLRVEHWPGIAVPCLFLQGTRDDFGSIESFEQQLGKLPSRARLHVVEGGDHSLRIARSAATDGRVHPAEEVVGALGPVVADWAATLEQ